MPGEFFKWLEKSGKLPNPIGEDYGNVEDDEEEVYSGYVAPDTADISDDDAKPADLRIDFAKALKRRQHV